MSLPITFAQAPVSELRTAGRGALAIAGITKVLGVPAPCRVSLHRVSDGINIAFRRTGIDGAYSLPDLAADAYYLVILDDRQNTKRAKVEHVTLA